VERERGGGRSEPDQEEGRDCPFIYFGLEFVFSTTCPITISLLPEHRTDRRLHELPSP